MTEPLTREQLETKRQAILDRFVPGTFAKYRKTPELVALETALHYEARSRETGELLVEAQNRLREVEADNQRRQEEGLAVFHRCQELAKRAEKAEAERDEALKAGRHFEKRATDWRARVAELEEALEEAEATLSQAREALGVIRPHWALDLLNSLDIALELARAALRKEDL